MVIYYFRKGCNRWIKRSFCRESVTAYRSGSVILRWDSASESPAGRYLLMSCALSQKLPQSMPLIFRMIIGFDVTDEMFGISIAQEGYLNEWYFIGAMCMAVPGWSAGAVFGVILGNILSARLVSALSIMLFGMFIAIIIPVGKADKKVLLCIFVSFIASFAFSRLSSISSGMQTIILTLVISAAAALIFPKKEEQEQ